MGFFDNLKKMMGVSGIKADLILPQNQYQQGDTISGVVRITGGPEARMANKLTLTLTESYPEIIIRTTPAPVAAQPPDASQPPPSEPLRETKTEVLAAHHFAHPPIILAQQFQIPAGAALEYPISVKLPAQAAVSGPCQEWHLKTELDIAGAFDAADTDRITVTPAGEMQPVREFICKGARYPTNCLLRIEAINMSGERVSNRVYYL